MVSSQSKVHKKTVTIFFSSIVSKEDFGWLDLQMGDLSTLVRLLFTASWLQGCSVEQYRPGMTSTRERFGINQTIIHSFLSFPRKQYHLRHLQRLAT
jgi:hypothetical protein